MKLKRIMAMVLCFAMVLSTMSFSVFAEAAETTVAKIGEAEYEDFNSAMTAANTAEGTVEVEIYSAVEFTDGMELKGNYDSITFVGKDTDAKITINQTAGGDYLEAHGKTVAFTDLTLAKANPAWFGNSGHMGNYFSVQGGTVSYTNCTFPNGACTNTGTATYNNCTFQNSSEYGLWVYDDALVAVNGGTIDSKKGIKVYSEGEDSVTSTLTVQNATFTENVTAKPAVAIGYAESITLIGNTYENTTGVLELDSGSDADCEGVTFVAKDAQGNDIASTLTAVDRSKSNAACGVLMDGKIYTTVTEAAKEAESGSAVTLLHNSDETVELPEGVTLDTNSYSAENVTVNEPVAPTPAGDITTGYVTANYYNSGKSGVFGEAVGVVGTESFVVKLYSGETLVGTAALIDSNKVLLNGESQSVTWHILAAQEDDEPEWWDTDWVTALNVNAIPDKVELYVDDVLVDTGVVELNNVDQSAPICAAVTNADGNVQSFVAGTGYLNGVGTNVPVYDAGLQEALSAGGNIVMLRDVGLTETIVVDKDITLDLNGKTLTNVGGTGTHTFRVAADMTVKDSSNDKTGKIDNTAGGYCFIVGYNTPAAGNLIVESGNYYGNTTVISVTYGTATIKGGYFEATPYEGSYDFTFNCVDRFYEAGTAKVVVSGGTFANFNPFNNAAEGEDTNFCAEGYAALLNLDDQYVVGEKPTATVNDLGAMTISESDYTVYGGSKSGDMPLSFVMQFLADQDAEDMTTSPYADWYGDFVLTFSGIENDSFTADGCYLAGYYGSFGWVKVPVDGMTIKNGVRYPVMLGVGMGQKYDYICESVKDFRCALYLTPEILAANPDIQVSLELSIVDNSKGSDAATEALADTTKKYVNVVGETTYQAEDFASKTYVAQNGDEKYETLAAALTAAQNGDTVKLIWSEGDAPIAMNGAVYGKSVTITGTATVDWSKGYLFIGRGGEGNGTVTFDNTNLTSASDSASYGIHVSGREKDTDDKYDGTLIINNSTIELDYLINKGNITLDNSALAVKNGFSIGGRPASETESGEDATATLALNNNSKVIVNNHNGMGLGYEAIGVMNIDATSAFETTQSFLVTANGTMNIEGTAKIAGTLTNNGEINLADANATLTSSECGNVTAWDNGYNVVYADGVYVLEKADLSGDDSHAFGAVNASVAFELKDGYYTVVTLAAIDTLYYSNVGFEITFDGEMVEKTTNVVYKTIRSTDAVSGEVQDYTAAMFGNDKCSYIFGQMIEFAEAHAGKNFTYRPFATKLDGTRVYGKQSEAKIGG